jgi:hypothetical protein
VNTWRFIAQDREKAFSQLVKTKADKEEDNEKVAEDKGLNYIGLFHAY